MQFKEHPTGHEKAVIKEVGERLQARIYDLEERGDALQFSGPNFDPISRADYQAVFSKFIHAGDKILAVGAGIVDIVGVVNYQTSELVKVTELKGAELFISDINFNNLKTHKDNHELRESAHVHIVGADATKLPLADASIHGITSSNLINCPPLDGDGSTSMKERAGLFLKDSWRVLKPGGFILVTSFGYSEERDEKGGPVINDGIDMKDAVTLKHLESLLEKTGFINIKELNPDDERVNEVHLITSGTNFFEAGGFIAFKPR